MDLFRITKKQYIRDLSGEGSRRFGGRWNEQGTAMLYASQNESLAALEILAHTPISEIPNDLSLLVLSIPSSIALKSVDPNELPDNWMDYPSPHELARIGSRWVQSGASLMLQVPSALVRTDWNVLINPAHPQMDKVKIKEVFNFQFDSRIPE
ncbi:RES family NAD+ phosphorylase [Rhodohalobacter sulfatireducens]|uniref:RES family NAD+ phosphorylase n=1 Tax=Rhodohalobacter sulfatireducens TaxID=2911366 RepID=A0ABS9KCX4_9BACT|nr:RES family NAD+ phosphorylase [Rhodohalobacter sulfatireducens]MCG2588707.1 RES family NAD+ phosphorylase [Rhodohalobacter sulfatireducens]